MKIYLDTSDYARLYRDNAPKEIIKIRERLAAYVDGKQIQIGFSFVTIFELLQDCEPEFIEDRRKRSRIVSRLCGNNCFPFFNDLLRGHTFSTDGAWMPREALEHFSFAKLRREFAGSLKTDGRLNRDQRRKLANASFLRQLGRGLISAKP